MHRSSIRLIEVQINEPFSPGKTDPGEKGVTYLVREQAPQRPAVVVTVQPSGSFSHAEQPLHVQVLSDWGISTSVKKIKSTLLNVHLLSEDSVGTHHNSIGDCLVLVRILFYNKNASPQAPLIAPRWRILTNKPNYLVEHKDGWKVKMYLSPQILARLRSRDSERVRSAWRAICTRFRKGCEAQLRSNPSISLSPPPLWVNRRDLTLTPLLLPKPASVDAEEDECDECVMCELGDHHRCQHDCPIGLRLLSR